MSARHTEQSTAIASPDISLSEDCLLSKDCPTRDVLNRVGDKWSVLVVVLLGQRTHRFNELHRSIEGISQRMLTLTVRALERDGLVKRTVYASVPPRVDYELTDLGRTLLAPLEALHVWATAHRADIQAARERHDSAQG